MANITKAKQTVREHLKELRGRFFVCVGFFISLTIVIYFIYEPIIAFLGKTLGSELYYNTPAGGFSFVMRICTTGAMILTVPVIVYHIIKFIKPAFERILSTRKIIFVSIFSTVMAICGSSFAYFIILPESLHFFGEFNISGLNALISADEYLSFILSMVVVFAIVFQVPLLMLLADNIKPIPPKKLIKNEIWVVVIGIIIAIITPFNYDILSSLVVSIPIIGLYNLSIIFILFKRLVLNLKSKNNHVGIIVKPIVATEFSLTNNAFELIKNDIIDIETKFNNTILAKNEINKKPMSIDFKVRTIKNIQQDNLIKKHNHKDLIQQTIPRKKAFFDIIPNKISRA